MVLCSTVDLFMRIAHGPYQTTKRDKYLRSQGRPFGFMSELTIYELSTTVMLLPGRTIISP